jgi:hypothetical protein
MQFVAAFSQMQALVVASLKIRLRVEAPLSGLIFLVMFGGINVPHSALAEDLTLSHEVFIEPRLAPRPNVIVHTHDDDVVIAGSVGKEAWAVKTNADGKVKWRYTVPPFDKSVFGMGPEYHSAAVMPDDSVFLCGDYPRSSGSPISGLFTRISKEGEVIKEQLLIPQNDSGRSINRFYSCVPHDGGVLIVGSSTQFYKNDSTSASNKVPYESKDNYWVLTVDQNEKVKSEKLISIDKNAGFDHVTLLQTASGDIVFAAARNSIETEIVRISPDGVIKARTVIPQAFLIVQPTDQDMTLQLVSVTTNSLTLITLDDSLRETSRVVEKHEPGVVYEAYRLSDKSLMLFGSKGEGDNLFAQVAKFDPTLKHEQTLELAPQGGSYWVSAAVPSGADGQFACVRGAIKPSKLGQVMNDEMRAQSRLGVAIDFIKTK